MIRCIVAAAAVLVVGCLSGPIPTQPTCGAPADFPAQAWPPSGMQLGIRDIVAADVNNDGVIDLIVTNTEVGTDDYGIFVLLGPQSDFATLQYHAFIATNVAPWSIAATDLDNDGCSELIAFGANKSNDAGLIDVFGFDTSTHTWTPALQKPVGFVPTGDGLPVNIVFGDFDGDGNALDVAVSDYESLRIFPLGDDLLSNLPTASADNVGPTGAPGAWLDINKLYVRPSVDGLASNDLLIVEQGSLIWLQNDGTGNFGAPFTHSAMNAFSSRAIAEVDLDGVPPLDIVGAAGVSFGAHLIAQTDSTLNFETRRWANDLEVSNTLNGIVVGQLGGPAPPEVVVFEVDESVPATDPSRAILIDGLFVPDAGVGLEPVNTNVLDFSAGIDLHTGIIVDFNNDGAPEVWAFDLDGDVRCMRRNANSAMLELCP